LLQWLLIAALTDSWRDHDIQEHAERCMGEAIEESEAAGWATKESVKVIGT